MFNYLPDTVVYDYPRSEWMTTQDGYDRSQNLTYESLLSLSNGYMGIRSIPLIGQNPSLPYFFINGIFDKSETFMKELATLPNPLGIHLSSERTPIDLSGTVHDFHRALDMRHGSLMETMLLTDAQGRTTKLQSLRFVDRTDRHRMGIRLWVTPIDWDGICEINQLIDGSIINFADAPRFSVKHTRVCANETLDESRGAYMEVETRDDHIHVGVGTAMIASVDGQPALGHRDFHSFGEKAVEFGDVHLKRGQTCEITKAVSVFDSRDISPWHLHDACDQSIRGFFDEGFDQAFARHCEQYRQLWEQANITIEGDPIIDHAVRFNVFHLMSAGNPQDSRINIGGKLLSGEEYGGHAFWDTELFMLPYFSYVFPRVARNLETYRYDRLGAAEKNARRYCQKGARYPWESADDGSEQCPDWTIEYDGTATPCVVADYELHVTAAVAYGIYNYVTITNDRDFLSSRGMPILVQTAKFWAHRCEWNQERQGYEITRVMGPDEWHEIVDNNTYTNYLARWNIRYARQQLESLKQCDPHRYEDSITRYHLTHDELALWQKVADNLYLPHQKNSDLLEQFEGYFKLLPLTITAHDKNDWPIRPQRPKGTSWQDTQIIKQADVVMLLSVLPNDFSFDQMRTNYEYYEKRTLHGSSLSPSVYALVGLRAGFTDKAYRYMKRAALLDLLDLQHNDREGIHAANAAGVWQDVVLGFAGVNIDADGILCITPRLPSQWKSVTFRLHVHGSWLEIHVRADSVPQVRLLSGPTLTCCIGGHLVQVNQTGTSNITTDNHPGN